MAVNHHQMYEQAEPQRLLTEADYGRINDLPDASRDRLPEDILRRYYSTAKWHSRQKFTLDSIEGIVVGGKTVGEIPDDSR